jgi:hypothetical protein
MAAVYDKNDYLEERTELAQRLAGYIESLAPGLGLPGLDFAEGPGAGGPTGADGDVRSRRAIATEQDWAPR